ncbi:MAG: hypothetical protein JWL77_6885 [Chthonomonadaceae bacterium]|nr:hypothetical protein [Chthonomonadaceae bacterium]
MKTSIQTLVAAASLAIIAAVSFTPTPATAACIRCAGKLFCGWEQMPIGCLNDIRRPEDLKRALLSGEKAKRVHKRERG